VYRLSFRHRKMLDLYKAWKDQRVGSVVSQLSRSYMVRMETGRRSSWSCSRRAAARSSAARSQALTAMARPDGSSAIWRQAANSTKFPLIYCKIVSGTVRLDRWQSWCLTYLSMYSFSAHTDLHHNSEPFKNEKAQSRWKQAFRTCHTASSSLTLAPELRLV